MDAMAPKSLKTKFEGSLSNWLVTGVAGLIGSSLLGSLFRWVKPYWG